MIGWVTGKSFKYRLVLWANRSINQSIRLVKSVKISQIRKRIYVSIIVYMQFSVASSCDSQSNAIANLITIPSIPFLYASSNLPLSLSLVLCPPCLKERGKKGEGKTNKQKNYRAKKKKEKVKKKKQEYKEERSKGGGGGWKGRERKGTTHPPSPPSTPEGEKGFWGVRGWERR